MLRALGCGNFFKDWVNLDDWALGTRILAHCMETFPFALGNSHRRPTSPNETSMLAVLQARQ
jgi:hypothetical protein